MCIRDSVVSRCDLDLWPLNVENVWYVGCHVIKLGPMYKIWSRSINPRMSYWRFSQFLNAGIFKLYSLVGVGHTTPDLGRTDLVPLPSSLHQIDTLALKQRIAMRCFVSKWGPLKEEWCRRSRSNFIFWPPPTAEIRGGIERMLRWGIEYTLRPNLW